MDRYHLAWLMVGKPKGIVRGRADDRRRGGGLRPRGREPEDRGAPDEPRRRRAPGDAVPSARPAASAPGRGWARCRRPTAPIRRRRTWPRLAAVDPARSRDAAPPRRGPPGGRRARRPRRRRRPRRDPQGATAGAPPAVTPARRTRPSAAPATSRCPTPSPATTSSSRSGSTSTCPGPSTASSGRPRSRPRSTWSSCGRRRASPTTRVALRARLDAEVPDARRRHWLDLQLVALETLARVRAGEDDPVPRPGPALLRDAPRAARPDATVRGEPPRRSTSCLPGHGTPGRAAGRRRTTPGPCRPIGSAAVVEALVPRYRARAASLRRAARAASRCASSLVRGQPWCGYNWYDGGYRSRVDFNLDLPIRLPNLVAVVAHETYPGHHLEHAEQGAAAGRGARPPRVARSC